jgi:hypothetical protein
MTLQGLNHLTLAVSDLERAWQFYTAVLGAKPEARWAAGGYLTLGGLWLCLSRDNRSEGESFYFLDPDGHQLELHVGSLASRLAACRIRPYQDMQFFD